MFLLLLFVQYCTGRTSVQKKSFNILHSPHPPPNSGSGVGVLLLLYDPVLTIEISVSDVCGR